MNIEPKRGIDSRAVLTGNDRWTTRWITLSGESMISLSEITTTTSVGIRPTRKPAKGLILKIGRGFKLDKTPDGWALNSIAARSVNLSREFLEKRGWQSDLFVPFRKVVQESAAEPSHER